MSTPNLKLHYFQLPGRAEATRLTLTIGGIAFEDHRFEFADWPAIKPTMPNEQAPVLEVDSVLVPQTNAILRYAGKLAGLYPTDALAALHVDSWIDSIEDAGQTLAASHREADLEKKIAARKELQGENGKLTWWLKKLDGRLAANNGLCVGDAVTIADIALFTWTSGLVCGFMEGIEKSYLDSFPHVQALRAKVAAIPAVAGFYAKETSPFRAVYANPQ